MRKEGRAHLLVELSRLNHLAIDRQLPLSGSENVLLNRLVRNQSEDLHSPLLTDSMSTEKKERKRKQRDSSARSLSRKDQREKRRRVIHRS